MKKQTSGKTVLTIDNLLDERDNEIMKELKVMDNMERIKELERLALQIVDVLIDMDDVDLMVHMFNYSHNYANEILKNSREIRRMAGKKYKMKTKFD